MKFSAPYIWRRWKQFTIILVVLVMGSTINCVTPYIWGKILDALANGQVSELATWLPLYFLITYVVLGFGYLEGYWGSKLTYSVETEIKQELMDKTLRMPCSNLDDFDAGTLVSRITSDSGTVISFVFDFLSSIITIIINIFASLYFSLKLSSLLSGVALAFIPLSIISNFIFKKAFKVLALKQREYGDRLSSFLVSTLSHIQEMKSYCLEKRRSKEYKDMLREGWVLRKKQYFLSSKASLFSSFISSASTIAVLVLSATLIAQRKLTLGSMVSFQQYIDKLTGAVSSLLQMNYSAQSAGVAVDRITEMLMIENEATEGSSDSVVISTVEFRNVSFAYREGEETLHDICFAVDQPGLYTFVGDNGGGKTTILKLLMRYYDPSHGHILINDVREHEISLDCVRHSIGYYAKEVYIQNDTLLANLLIGTEYTPTTLPSELTLLCETVGLMTFIDSLQDGWDTIVGENGKLLSSGQKQKIAIVRAFLDNSSLLLLDEITSDLDAETEEAVVSALAEVAKNKIIFLVTHRVCPLQAAKEVFLIKSGRIIFSGGHRELKRTSPYYDSFLGNQE